jgi:hypothetical protein
MTLTAATSALTYKLFLASDYRDHVPARSVPPHGDSAGDHAASDGHRGRPGHLGANSVLLPTFKMDANGQASLYIYLR